MSCPDFADIRCHYQQWLQRSEKLQTAVRPSDAKSKTTPRALIADVLATAFWREPVGAEVPPKWDLAAERLWVLRHQSMVAQVLADGVFSEEVAGSGGVASLRTWLNHKDRKNEPWGYWIEEQGGQGAKGSVVQIAKRPLSEMAAEWVRFVMSGSAHDLKSNFLPRLVHRDARFYDVDAGILKLNVDAASSGWTLYNLLPWLTHADELTPTEVELALAIFRWSPHVFNEGRSSNPKPQLVWWLMRGNSADPVLAGKSEMLSHIDHFLLSRYALGLRPAFRAACAETSASRQPRHRRLGTAVGKGGGPVSAEATPRRASWTRTIALCLGLAGTHVLAALSAFAVSYLAINFRHASSVLEYLGRLLGLADSGGPGGGGRSGASPDWSGFGWSTAIAWLAAALALVLCVHWMMGATLDRGQNAPAYRAGVLTRLCPRIGAVTAIGTLSILATKSTMALLFRLDWWSLLPLLIIAACVTWSLMIIDIYKQNRGVIASWKQVLPRAVGVQARIVVWSGVCATLFCLLIAMLDASLLSAGDNAAEWSQVSDLPAMPESWAPGAGTRFGLGLYGVMVVASVVGSLLHWVFDDHSLLDPV